MTTKLYAEATGERMRCLACKVKYQVRPRGLCHGCYRDAATRAQHPPGAVGRKECYVRPEDVTAVSQSPLPPQPTLYLPGTDAKILVMRMRAKLGYCLFHPDDARWGEPGNAHPPLPPTNNEPLGYRKVADYRRDRDRKARVA